MKDKMKTYVKIFLLLFSELLLILLAGCAGAQVTEEPIADLKILVPSGSSLIQTFGQAEKVILAHGFTKQPGYGQGELFTQDYRKNNLEISYQPYDRAQIKLKVIYLYYYETDRVQ